MNRENDTNVSGERPEQTYSAQVEATSASPFRLAAPLPLALQPLRLLERRAVPFPPSPFLMLALVACGGGGGGGTSLDIARPPPPLPESKTDPEPAETPVPPEPLSRSTTFVIHLGKRPVIGATVYEDVDGDGRLSPEEREKPVGVTGEQGLVTIPATGSVKRHLAQFRKPEPETQEPSPPSDPPSDPPSAPQLAMWSLSAGPQKETAGQDGVSPVSPQIALLLMDFQRQAHTDEVADDEGRIAPRIRLLIATDPDDGETTASLGFAVKTSESTTPIVLRSRGAQQADETGAVNDLPPNMDDNRPALPDDRLPADNLVLNDFLESATYILPSRHGYLLVYFDSDFDDPAPDGGGAWVFAYFTPAHLGYNRDLLTATDRGAIEATFAGLKAGGATQDGFVFTATNAAGETVSITHRTAVVGVNDAPQFKPHGIARATVTENTEPGAMLAVLIADVVPDGLEGLQISDPDPGDTVTVSLAPGKDAALFELVGIGDGQFRLVWKADADGQRLAPDFERTRDNNYRVSHDDDGIFEVDLIARDSTGRETRHGFEVEVADNPDEPPSLQIVRKAGQSGPIMGSSRGQNLLHGTSGEVYFSGENSGQRLTISLAFGGKPAGPMQISLDPVLSDKLYRFGDNFFSQSQYLELSEQIKKRTHEYNGTLYKLVDDASSDIYVFNGQYGKVTVSLPTTKGHLNRMNWKYEAYADYGSGGPFNRLKLNELATETITFVVKEGTRESAQTISLDLVGGHDRPVIVSETDVGGFLPASKPRPWSWWQDTDIIQRRDPFKSEQKGDIPVKSGDERTVLRFLAVDEDGGYFKPSGDKSKPSNYGPIKEFVEEFIRLVGRDANLFEVVQATDADGMPHYVPLPYDNNMLIPVLEIRFKSLTDKVPGISYSLTLEVKDDAKPDKLLAGVTVKLGFIVKRDQSVGQSANNVGQTAGARGDIGVLEAAWDSEDLPVPLSASMAADMM